VIKQVFSIVQNQQTRLALKATPIVLATMKSYLFLAFILFGSFALVHASCDENLAACASDNTDCIQQAASNEAEICDCVESYVACLANAQCGATYTDT
jgi:hypothetical protein